VARQVQVKLVDDVDGSVASETVTFGLDGRQYELDLSEANAARLRHALAPFVAAARRSSGSSSGNGRGGRGHAGGGGAQSPPAASERVRNAAIREWARQHGRGVSRRGRMPASVLEAYRNEVG
jgi:nucleoid-associated protein Lsr2